MTEPDYEYGYRVMKPRLGLTFAYAEPGREDEPAATPETAMEQGRAYLAWRAKVGANNDGMVLTIHRRVKPVPAGEWEPLT